MCVIKKIFSNAGSLILINLGALVLISIWAVYYNFGPMLVGVSASRAMQDFIVTEVVFGGGFVVLFNAYVLYRTVMGKNKRHEDWSSYAKTQLQ